MIQVSRYSREDRNQVLGIVREVTALWGSGWTELVSEMFADGRAGPFRIERFVAKREGQVLGLLVMKQEICASVIYFLAAKSGSRGKGVGSLLIKHAEEFARKSECAFLRVDVYEHFGQNRDFYLKNGFLPSGKVKNYYELGDSQVFFYKKIRKETRR